MNLTLTDLKALYRLLEHQHIPYDDPEAIEAIRKLMKIIESPDGIHILDETLEE